MKQNVPELRFKEFEGEWEEKKLGELTETFKSGNSITSKDIFESGTYPVYGGNGLRGFAYTYTHDGFHVLIGRQGALCGNINRVKGKTFISEHAIAVKADRNNDTEWLAQKLELLNLNQYSESSAQPGLAVNKLVKFKIPVPSLPEQQKIASFLTAVDARLQLLRQQKALLEEYKKGLMQRIFSQELRFKKDDGREFEEWEEQAIAEISIKKSSPIAANSIEENFGDYLIYGASGILKRINFYQEENDYISIVKDGAGVGRLFYCKGQSSVLGTMDIIKPKEGVDSYFLYYLLQTIDFSKFITGSTIPHIYYKDYSKEIVGVPCLSVQQKIAQFLCVLDEKINGLTEQIAQTEVWKKGLMQRMFV